MKKVLYLCCIALTLVACKEELEVVTSNPYNSSVTGTCIRGAVPQWEQDSNTTYSSMSIIIDQYGVPCAVDSTDQIAAFVGTSCRGVVKPFKDASDKWRFNLPVKASASDEGQVQFELRYYSAIHQGTYTSKLITYNDGAILGSVLIGYQPNWK